MLVDFDEASDLDWFAVDDNGVIAHFATGGPGAVPVQWLRNRELLQELSQLLLSVLQPISDVTINPLVEQHLAFPSLEARENYLRSFVQMASYGMSSFDYLHDHAPPTPYLLVATPVRPVLFSELALDVQVRLRPLVISGWTITNVVDFSSIGQ